MPKDAPQSRPATKSSRPTLIDLVEEMSAYECFAGDGPCPTRYEAGTRPILIVSGSNAGGKSLYLRALSAQLQAGAKPAPEVMLISMNLRIQPDIRRAFIFGEDKTSSTENISVRTALAGIRNSRDRTHPHILMLDEPDIGLSEGYQKALGEELAAYAADLPPSALGFVLVSHSRALIAPFVHLRPAFVRVGDDLRPTRQWLTEGDLPRSRSDLVELGAAARQRYLAVKKLLRKT